MLFMPPDIPPRLDIPDVPPVRLRLPEPELPPRLRKLPDDSPTKALESRAIAALLLSCPVCSRP